MKSLGWVIRIWTGPALLAVLLLALGAVAPAHGQSDADSEESQMLLPALRSTSDDDAQAAQAFVPGEIAVGVRRDAIGAAAVTAGIEPSVIETMSLAGLDGADGDAGVDGYLLRVPAGEEWETIERLSDDPAVAFAEPNWYVYAAQTGDELGAAEMPFTVNDPLYAAEQWYMQRIMASRAWAASERVDSATVEPAASLPIEVTVIDSGVDSTHRDLRDNLSLTGKNYFSPTLPPDDDCGHGTHVAGLIAAGINNGRGIAGGAADVRVAAYKTLAWGPDRNNPGRFACTGPVSLIVNAIEDATDAGADIINLSLDLDVPWTPLEAAVNNARSRGVLVITAAGNCKFLPDCPVKYPAKYGAVLAVAATDYHNGRAPYSPKGDELDLAAPGGTLRFPVLSTWPPSVANLCPGVFRLVQGDGYCEEFGTSTAAAVATGAAALAWSVRPELDAEAMRDLLEETTQPLPLPDDEVGDGLVDAHWAVRYALRSRLDVEPQSLSYALVAGAEPFETTLRMENPSLEPMTWTITETQDIAWLDVAGPVSGTVGYGEPVRVPLVISATHLVTGVHHAAFALEGVRANGSQVVDPVNARLEIVRPPISASYLPAMADRSYAPLEVPYAPYAWERPDEMGRREAPLLKDSSTGITLPVTISVGSRVYTDVRVYSDGYVVVPASAQLREPANACLPLTAVEGFAVFGWWSDLDPTRLGGSVSVFRAGADRSVIEFENVYAAGGERVTFQVVLFADGRVGINYQKTPRSGVDERPTPATVGVQRLDGRFFNQIACVSDNGRFGRTEIGELPQSFQSLLFTEEDLF